MKILALDVGDRRIGIAASDPLGILATGLGVVKRDGSPESNEAAAKEIITLAKNQGADTLLVGLPKNMDGTIGFQAKKVYEFMDLLTRQWPIKVKYWDERLTTVSAHQTMALKKTKIKKRKEEVDKIAACYILQSYLDSAEFKRERS